ncbi:hypothetical protein HMPREF1549_00195 [Actinomyces johnsonii F0510]|uniref:Uncharacterized protein n=1 Tax=Actinomyces johnsonii F0510 TaxID=1227262 RepID=U1RY03_9ACTO|nr:hypothetical protein HMPREF1549_00195 [Actinomyces johnsonii F0510]
MRWRPERPSLRRLKPPRPPGRAGAPLRDWRARTDRPGRDVGVKGSDGCACHETNALSLVGTVKIGL